MKNEQERGTERNVCIKKARRINYYTCSLEIRVPLLKRCASYRSFFDVTFIKVIA